MNLTVKSPEKELVHSFCQILKRYYSNTNHFSFAAGFAWAGENPYSLSGCKCIAATHTHTLTSEICNSIFKRMTL